MTLREPSIDAQTIQSLRDLGSDDDDLLGEVIELYLDDSRVRIETMRAALAASDSEQLSGAAHAMKSASANVGAMGVRKLCESIEMIGRGGTVDGAAALFEDLQREYDAAKAELEVLQSHGSA
jgi:HPt (histidine-containing phosphotransfer) domain-containing protein